MAAPKTGWEAQRAAVYARYPSAAEEDWTAALADYDLMGRLIRDVLRVGHTPKQRGSRPELERDEALSRLNQLRGDDYTMLPFPEAFRALARWDPDTPTRSLTNIARRVDIPRSRTHRLLTGESKPSHADLEQIAAAFGRRPTYFAEYRIALVVAAIEAHLEAAPEATVGIVRQLGTNLRIGR